MTLANLPSLHLHRIVKDDRLAAGDPPDLAHAWAERIASAWRWRRFESKTADEVAQQTFGKAAPGNGSSPVHSAVRASGSCQDHDHAQLWEILGWHVAADDPEQSRWYYRQAVECESRAAESAEGPLQSERFLSAAELALLAGNAVAARELAARGLGEGIPLPTRHRLNKIAQGAAQPISGMQAETMGELELWTYYWQHYCPSHLAHFFAEEERLEARR